jgi:Chemoreceptor zinc-binding domain
VALLDFFKSLGTTPGDDRTQPHAGRTLAALDLDTAIDAHEHWKTDLIRYLQGQSAEAPQADGTCGDDGCDLGRWIRGDGQKHFGKNALFSDLRTLHETFHKHAASVVALHRAGRRSEARMLLHGDYAKASERIVRRLKDLKLLNESSGG